MKAKITTALLYLSLAFTSATAGDKVYTAMSNVHSHNDYSQDVPFYRAYCARCASIEADIHLVNGVLYVGHNAEDVKPERTLQALYLDPIRQQMIQNGGSGYPDGHTFQLLIDLKTEGRATMKALETLLLSYRDCFDTQANSGAVTIVITGNHPEPKDFNRYAPFIMYDGESDKTYTPEQLSRVALISVDYRKVSHWRGKGRMPNNDYSAVEQLTREAHALGKPIRFWASPDTPLAWTTFEEMGIDLINTDHPTLISLWMEGSIELKIKN